MDELADYLIAQETPRELRYFNPCELVETCEKVKVV